MNDREFLDALESCALPPAEFRHAAHVRAGYLYLRCADFPTALQAMRTSIRRYAAHLGKPDLYHETITVAYLALIQQHMLERGDGEGWPGFERGNRELFDPALLLRFYTKDELSCAAARRIFLLPGRASMGGK